MSKSLNVLLSHALISVTRIYEAETPLPLYAVLLRAIPDDGISVKELPATARISKRAGITLVNNAEKLGYVATKGKSIHLTKAGVAACAQAEAALATAEAKWQPTPELRSILEKAVGTFPREYPHFWIHYGTADLSLTGGAYPHNGNDWKEVLRTDPSSAKGLPIASLLAQALCDFTLRYEATARFSLAWTIFGLLPMPTDGVAFADAPPTAALNGKGTSMLERHGLVTVDAHRIARLTPRGMLCRSVYESTIESVEHEWAAAFELEVLRNELLAIDEPDFADHPALNWFGTLQLSS